MQVVKEYCDILILGGGTAGCYAALTIAKQSNVKTIVVEKANIKRSGCLAAGVNAINAYIVKGRTPEDYVDYAKQDAHGIVREDLLLTMARGVNDATKELEKLGLVILKDSDGEYVSRGNRNIKINGENIKPILAKAVNQCKNVTVFNHVTIIDYIVVKNEIKGAIGFSIDEEIMYVFEASAVICATGGAAGLYRPNNPGGSRHKMWYPPFNTGAGYAMGIKAGAEMTSFEMRFIALRLKDTIAPTGTIAQGVFAKQINSCGEEYERIYGNTTSDRVYATVKETMEGRGPSYLKTKGITKEQEQELLKAYLNMAPSQTLAWLESGRVPSEYNAEIEGTEPYIVGGHTASGYWVDTNRATTIKGLYAAGDVAGGCPQKYVTGALVEGEIAAIASLEYIMNMIGNNSNEKNDNENLINKNLDNEILNKETTNNETAINETIISEIIINETINSENINNVTLNDKNLDNEYYEKNNLIKESMYDFILQKKNELESHLNSKHNTTTFSYEELEEAMQKIMDTYAGGIGANYQYNESTLKIAEDRINQVLELSRTLHANDMQELMYIYELKERLIVSLSVIAHLKSRKETRWHSFAEHMDYPEKDDNHWLKYVNSKVIDGELKVIYRDLVERGEFYEHSN